VKTRQGECRREKAAGCTGTKLGSRRRKLRHVLCGERNIRIVFGIASVQAKDNVGGEDDFGKGRGDARKDREGVHKKSGLGRKSSACRRVPRSIKSGLSQGRSVMIDLRKRGSRKLSSGEEKSPAIVSADQKGGREEKVIGTGGSLLKGKKLFSLSQSKG